MDGVARAAHDAMNAFLDDRTWQLLGFAKRPSYGLFWQKFRPAWKVQLEDTVTREIVTMIAVAYARAHLIKLSDVEKVIETIVNEDSWRSFGFASMQEAQEQFKRSASRYLKMPVENWHEVLVAALGLPDLPDQSLAQRLLVGSVKLAQAVGDRARAI